MDAQKLFLEDGRFAQVYYCGRCRLVWRELDDADRCCRPYRCDQCGVETERYRTRCTDCQMKESEARLQRQWEKAEKLSAADYDGPVYSDIRSRWYPSAEEAFEDHEGEGLPLERIYACDVDHLRLDVRDALDSAIEGADLDPDFATEVDFVHVPELIDFVDRWNRKQTQEIWTPDFKQGVVPVRS